MMGGGTFAIPYEAVGVLGQGQELMSLWDELPAEAQHDRQLVDSWAAKIGMANLYTWIPYRP
jgi:hypothetical protein